MAERMSRAQLLENLKHARSEWDALLDHVGQDRMAVPGAAGNWRVQDVIAHISWGEHEAVRLLQTHEFDLSDPLWNMSYDDRNAVIYRMNCDRPYAGVLAEEQSTFAELVRTLESATDEDLNDTVLYPGMPPAWEPWKLVSGNSYSHYLEHIPSVREWLDSLHAKA